MSKTTGLGAGLYIGGNDVSGDINSVQRIACPRGAIDATDITQEAIERLLTHKDGGIDCNALFNPDRAHPVLSALPRADTGVIYRHRGTLGSPAACMVAKQVNYDGSRGQDGSFLFAVSTVANGFGLEWGELLTAGAVTHESDGEDGDSLDYGASIGTTAFGLQAYLQVLEFDGTDVDISVQHSSDNGGSDAFADITGAVFTTVTAAPHTERIQTARNASIERYLRVSTTGTFTSVTFAVAVVRNLATVVF